MNLNKPLPVAARCALYAALLLALVTLCTRTQAQAPAPQLQSLLE